MNRVKSDQLFAEALKYIPGGVNSPVRAFRAVGGNPFFVNRAAGSKVWDVDGNELIDYVLTFRLKPQGLVPTGLSKAGILGVSSERTEAVNSAAARNANAK